MPAEHLTDNAETDIQLVNRAVVPPTLTNVEYRFIPYEKPANIIMCGPVAGMLFGLTILFTMLPNENALVVLETCPEHDNVSRTAEAAEAPDLV